MANKNLFSTAAARIPTADAINRAGGKAYSVSAKHALAQYAVTGCFGTVFYATEQEQLAWVLGACEGLDDGFIARTAVYARERGHMKDMPALLLAVLATRKSDAFTRVFPRVCDNAKMLRNFVQIVRSGVTGRRSLGTRPKRMIQLWLEARSDDAIFRASVGKNPSLVDVIKMVHPTPHTATRRALYGYLLGKPYDVAALPKLVTEYEAFKRGDTKVVPNVPFQMLSQLDLPTSAWTEIARNAGWQMTRMNLNTFMRHGVFEDSGMVALVADRLRDPREIARSRVMPYQLMVAYTAARTHAPAAIRDALHDAMELSLANVPSTKGTVHVLIDVSGSMHSPVTGYRKGSTTVVRCIDVAALMAAAFLRTNSDTEVTPFHDRVQRCLLEPQDPVITNAERLARLPSGGTDCAAPLRDLNKRRAKGNLVIFVSDNQSWIDRDRAWNPGTSVMKEWNEYKRRNRKAKLVCIDIQPYASTQALDSPDVLNVGGFSDAVFDVVSGFGSDELDGAHWADIIERREL